jgi:hypothetical protein
VERALTLDRSVVEDGSRKFSWKTCADMFESWLVPCGEITPRGGRQLAYALPR